VSVPIPATYSRPISPDEVSLLARLDGIAEEVQLCIEGEGAIDPAALAEAVATASAACPGARLARDGRQWVDSGQPPPVRLVDAASFDRARLDSPLLRTPLACLGRPTCEVLVVPGTPATAVFRIHRGTMDGRGALFWQRQVFRALRGEAVEEATSTMDCEEAKAEIAASLGVELPEAAKPSGTEWRPVLGLIPEGPRRSIWRRRTIDGVHLGVTAKIARVAAIYGGGEAVVGIPVDLRQYLPEVRTTMAVTGNFKLHVREEDDWADVDARLLTALREYRFMTRSNADPTAPLMPLRLKCQIRRWADNLARKYPDSVKQWVDRDVTVSHLGAVELTDFCADGFEATSYYCLGAVTYMPEIDIVESRGRTEVTVAWRDGPGVSRRIESMLDRIEEELSSRSPGPDGHEA
jgi:hypothetical protein